MLYVEARVTSAEPLLSSRNRDDRTEHPMDTSSFGRHRANGSRRPEAHSAVVAAHVITVGKSDTESETVGIDPRSHQQQTTTATALSRWLALSSQSGPDPCERTWLVKQGASQRSAGAARRVQ